MPDKKPIETRLHNYALFFAGKPYPEVVLDGRGGGWFRKGVR